MAALKFLNSKMNFSLSQGWRSYFYCCFASSENPTSPSRSTEAVLKSDELGKNLSDEDESDLGNRQKLVADNFGYDSETPCQSAAEGDGAGDIGLQKYKSNSLRQQNVSEKSHIIDSALSSQQNENSTAAMKKGLDTILAMAAAGGDDAVSEIGAGDSQMPETCQGSNKQSNNSNLKQEEEESNMNENISPDHQDSSGHKDSNDDILPTRSSSSSSDNKKAPPVSSSDKKEMKTDDADDKKGIIISGDASPENPGSSGGASSVAIAAGGTMGSGGACSNLDVDVADGHLFDISDLQQSNSAGSNLISPCGALLVTLSHDSHVNRMSFTIHEARDLPSRERGGVTQVQIRTLLLPLRKVRHKTKVVVVGDTDPHFNETFELKVPTEELTNMGMRIRLYGYERLKKDRLIGETIINFSRLNTNNVPFWAPLEPRSNLSHGDSINSISSLTHSESDSSTHSLQHGGTLELMLGLSYNGVTGRMAIEVIKGSNFKNMAAKRPPDTYVKMALMAPNGQEITRSKTSIRRGQPNPLFKETFMFQVPQFQLPEVSLLVSVFVQKSLKRKEMIGWFTMGHTNSSEDDASHWSAMLESKGEQVCRWHALLEP